jgi:hypothetical protein
MSQLDPEPAIRPGGVSGTGAHLANETGAKERLEVTLQRPARDVRKPHFAVRKRKRLPFEEGSDEARLASVQIPGGRNHISADSLLALRLNLRSS